MVRASVIRLLQEIGGFDASILCDAAQFDRELMMKSIDFVEFRVAIEDEFQIEVDPLALIELNRLDRVLSYVTDLAEERTS